MQLGRKTNVCSTAGARSITRGKPGEGKMKRATCIICTIVIFLTLFFVDSRCVYAEEDSSLQNWIVYEYNETNGLPTGEANAVVQTRDGYVWIGSYGGLIRYDGTAFRNYSKEDAIPSSSIRALYEDRQGRLWIGTNDRGVYFYENHEFVHCEYENGQDFLSVRSFAEDSEGKIYVGTTSGLAEIKDNRLSIVNDAAYGMTVYSLAIDGNGVLWACIDDGTALLLDGNELIYTFHSDVLEANLYCAGTTRDGSLYLGTDENLVYGVEFLDKDYEEDSFQFYPYKTGEVSTANNIAQDEQGNIWIAALNGTGYLDKDHDWHPITAKHVTAINTIAFDYEGNVWLASTGYGVIHLVNGVYYNANDRAGISETAINAAAVCGGSYYLATDTGLIVLNNKFEAVENELTKMLQGVRIRSVLCDSRGDIWIGTYYQHGLLLYEPEENKITFFTQNEGLSDEQIRAILECSDGSIAVSSQNGISILKDRQVIKTYTDKEGISYPIILCLCEGKDGTLYAGSDGQGIYAIKDDKVTHYGFDEGLEAGVVLRMLPEDNGEGMFISAGNGLYYWDFETFREMTNYDKSPGSIFDLYINGGDLWLMQSNGINVLNKEQLLSGKETPVKVIGVSSGLTGTLNANNWNTEDNGRFYLCTDNGVSVLDMSRLEGEQKNIHVVMNQVTVDDAVYEMPEIINMEGNTTRLTLQFAALSYSGRELKVRYRLKGFDEEPHNIVNTQPMSASYTNLSGGDYEFLVEILAPDGESVLTSSSVLIHKDYRIWEHKWFWAVAAVFGLILVSLIIWLGIRLKTLRLKRRQAEYRNIINQSLNTFANTIDAKDKYTNGHSQRVAVYSRELAKKLKMSKEEQERIYYIALMHDIGKIGISDEILNKPGKLTKQERKIIMSHPAIGGEILKDFTSLPGISEGARYHHERYDGKGYNEGLKGEEIPFFARIICVADSYDAMSSTRCYRKDLNEDTILKELKDNAGTQFDPDIVAVMLELIAEGAVPVDIC